jgi:hypothetical protein
MIRSPIRVNVVLALALAGLATSGACQRPGAKAPGPAESQASAGSSAYDAETTDIARVLAGMRPLRGQAFAALVALPEWREWEAEAQERWGAAWRDGVLPLRAWAGTALKGVASDCRTLLRPFGDTAFVDAYVMFPSCEGYVLVGTGPVGQLPSIDAITPSQFARVTEGVRQAFPDVFPPNAAAKRAGSPAASPLAGAIPALLVQLARLDARIVSAARFDVTADGRPLESIPIRGGNARPAALSFTFEVPNGRPQSLVYFPADLDDAAMRRRPGAWTFLRLQAPFGTLLVPRSSLQAERFSLLRGLILEQSRFILQAPPAWTPADGRGWIVSTLPAPPAPAFPRPFAPMLAVKRK